MYDKQTQAGSIAGRMIPEGACDAPMSKSAPQPSGRGATLIHDLAV